MTTNTNQSATIAFTASVSDQLVAPGRPGALEFSLTNSGQQTQDVTSGTVPPFGVVLANRVDGDGQFLLWRNYEDEGCVTFTDDGWAACAIGVVTHLSPGEMISRRYEILPNVTETHPEHTAPPGPGRYHITDTLTYSEEGGSPSTELSFDVEFMLDAIAGDA